MFKVKTYIPTLSSFCYLSEFTNKDYININKFILSKDNDGLCNYFDTFLNEKIKNSYDKLFILIYLRMLSIGNEVKLKYSDNTGYTASLSVMLDKFLKRWLENPERVLPDFEFEELVIKFKQPTQLFYNNLIELLIDIIKDIYIENKLNDYRSFKYETKKQVLSRLKEDVIIQLKNHLNNHSLKYPLSLIDNKSIFEINLYNSTTLKLLKLIFKNNLSNLYLKLYYCVQKLGLNYNDFCTITPSETELLLSIYKSVNNIK